MFLNVDDLARSNIFVFQFFLVFILTYQFFQYNVINKKIK